MTLLQSSPWRHAASLRALEQRLMFDGAVAAEAALVTAEATGPEPGETAPSEGDAAEVPAAAGERGRREVAFVDASLRDRDVLLANLPADIEVHVVEAGVDGFAFMAGVLDGREDVGGVHVLGHGTAGTARLGSATLSADSLAAHAESLSAVGESLTADGDILLYGCWVGAGEAGAELIGSVAALTGADVAASTDDTGAASRGGDWQLERQSGVIESVSLDLGEQWQQLLATYDPGWNSTAGEITADDPDNPTRAGTKWDRYAFTGINAGSAVQVYMRHGTLQDPYLQVVDAGGNLVVQDDDGGSGSSDGSYDGLNDSGSSYDSYLSFTYQDGYVLRATTFRDFSSGGAGAYTLFQSIGGAADIGSNTPPVAGDGTLSMNEGQTGSLDVSTLASDADDDPLAFSHVSGPGSLSGSTLSYTAGTDASLKGTHTVGAATYRTSDGAQSDDGSITLRVTYADDPTTWSGVADQLWASPGQTGFNFAYNASDPDDTVSYSYVSGAPEWASVSSTTLLGNPAPEHAGEVHTVTIRATGSNSVDTTFTLTVGEASQVNDLPTSADATRSLAEDSSLAFTAADFAFADPDHAASGSTAAGAVLDHVRITGVPAHGEVRLSGVAVSNGQHIAAAQLGNLSYVPATDYNGADAFRFRVHDGVGESASEYTMGLTVTPVNDAPVLGAGTADFGGITEDQTDNTGNAVAELLATAVSDADDATTGAGEATARGMAVHATANAGPGAGSWQFDTGAGWQAVGSVSSAAALLLDGNDRLRFVPDAVSGATATLAFYAWDGAGGSAGSRVDATTRGADSGFSSASATVNLDVDDVNDASTVSLPGTQSVAEDGSVTLSGIDLGDIDITGRADADTSNDEMEVMLAVGRGVLALAGQDGVVLVAGEDGVSRSLTVRGSLVSLNAAVDGLRYTPDADWNGTDTLSAELSDRGNVRGTGDAGSAALTATASMSLTVTPVNDAPVLTPTAPTLATISEDAGDDDGTGGGVGGDDDLVDNANNPGSRVADLLGVSDVDTTTAAAGEGTATGIAVFGLQRSGPGEGAWQYSLDAGGSWQAVGTVSAGSALLLGPDDRIRFVGDARNANVASIDFHAWDGASGSAGARADVTVRGASTAFSTAADTATVTVTAVNDQPHVDQGIVDQTVSGDLAHVAAFAADAFGDVDHDATLAYTARLADGSPLPAWLGFDPQSRSFNGNPPNDPPFLDVEVTATDQHGASASDVFRLTLDAPNDTPVAAAWLGSAVGTQGWDFNYDLPSGAFTDADVGDVLRYSAPELPAGLRIDPASGRISGRAEVIGTVRFEVFADDGHGGISRAPVEFLFTAPPQPAAAVPASPPVHDFVPPLSETMAGEGATGTPAGVGGGFEGPRAPGAASARAALAGFLSPPGTPPGIPDVLARPLQPTPPADHTPGPDANIAVGTDGRVRFDAPVDGLTVTDVRMEGGLLQVSVLDQSAGAVAFEARLADGSSLPSWLRVDPVSGALSGRPLPGGGSLDIVLVARDADGTNRQLNIHLELADLDEEQNVPETPPFAQQIRDAAAAIDAYGATLAERMAAR